MKRIAPLLLLLALGACQSTVFENAPLAAGDCDTALAGSWLSVGDSAAEDGEVEVRVDPACRIEVLEHEASGLRTGEATTFQVGVHEEERYLWVDATWVQGRFDPRMEARAGDVHVLRYRQRDDELLLWSADDVAIAHRIIDGDIPGEVRRIDGRLENRITGEANPAPLTRRDFFDREQIRFRRAGKGTP